MESSKQEMELFIPFPGLGSKNFIYKEFFRISQGFQNSFSKQEIELSKQEMELYLTLLGL